MAARNLHVSLYLCSEDDDEEEECSSAEEIDGLLDNSFLLMLTNQVKFDWTKTNEETIVKESIITRYNLQQDFSIQQPKSITHAELYLQDQLVNLNRLTAVEDDTLFSLEDQPSRILGTVTDDKPILSIAFEVGRDKRIIHRT